MLLDDRTQYQDLLMKWLLGSNLSQLKSNNYKKYKEVTMRTLILFLFEVIKDSKLTICDSSSFYKYDIMIHVLRS